MGGRPGRAHCEVRRRIAQKIKEQTKRPGVKKTIQLSQLEKSHKMGASIIRWFKPLDVLPAAGR
jgi:predicted GNAT superfamily acetyltransferase